MKIIALLCALLLPFAAHAQYAPSWRSYQDTGNPLDIVKSTMVATALGLKVDTSGGSSTDQTLTTPTITGGMSTSLSMTSPSITHGTFVNLDWSGKMSALNGGTIQGIYYLVPALLAEIASGTTTAPITTMGPSFRVSRTEQLAAKDCNSTYNNNECNAAIVGASYGTASDLMQTAGIVGVAVGQQTSIVPNESLDTVGVQGQGRVVGNGVGVGSGGFFQGIADSASGRAIGLESNVKNLSGANAPKDVQDGGSFPNILASCGAGTWPGQYKCNSGLQVTNSGSNYNYGVVVTNAVDDTAFYDNSHATNGLVLSAYHTSQIAGNGFYVNGLGNVWIGQNYNPGTGEHLTVLSADANQAYFGSIGANASFINIDNQTGGQKTVVQFADKQVAKWQLGKHTDNSFILWDSAASSLALQVTAGGPVSVPHGLQFPSVAYASLPAAPGPGDTMFCTNCYSSSRASGSTKTGILVTYANSEWEDAVGNTALH